MKKILTGLALAASMIAVSPQATAAEVNFIGRLIVYAAAGTCPSDPVGQRLFARWRPAGLGDNGVDSNFATFRTTQAVHYELEGLPFDATLRPVESMVITGGKGPLDYVARVSFNTIAPASVTDTTEIVNVTGKIRGFDFMPACTASFRFAGTKRVE